MGRLLVIVAVFLALAASGFALSVAQDATPVVTNELGTPCASLLASPAASPVASPAASPVASPVASPTVIVVPGCETEAGTPGTT